MIDPEIHEAVEMLKHYRRQLTTTGSIQDRIAWAFLYDACNHLEGVNTKTVYTLADLVFEP